MRVPLIKFAEPATGSSETQFEQALANLAHTFLRDKAPGLLPYEVGFQLIEKNEDNTKAIGITGFQVGSQWLYAPVLFLNGELKGHDVLYLKNQDTCVPLRENWLNDILNKKPRTLGSSTDRDSSRLGMLPPDLQAFSRSPSTYAKRGAVSGMGHRVAQQGFLGSDPDLLPGKRALAYILLGEWQKEARFQKKSDCKNLSQFLKRDLRLVEVLARTLQHSVKFASAFRRYYPDPGALLQEATQFHRSRLSEDLQARSLGFSLGVLSGPLPTPSRDPDQGWLAPLPKQAGVLPAKAWAKSARVTVITLALLNKSKGEGEEEEEGDEKEKEEGGEEEAAGRGDVDRDAVTEGEREQVFQDGLSVRDHREDHEVSQVYATPVLVRPPTGLTNPSETGIYNVMTKPAGMLRCLVVTQPFGHAGRQAFCTVVPLEKPEAWLNADPAAVWIQTSSQTVSAGFADASTGDDYQEWWKGLPDVKELPSGDGTYIILGPRAQATVPFSVLRIQKSEGIEAAKIHPHDDVTVKRPDYLPERGKPYRFGKNPADAYEPALRLTGRDSPRFTVQDGEIWIPLNCKLLKLDPEADEDTDNLGKGTQGDGFLLGDVNDFNRYFFGQTREFSVAGGAQSEKGAGYVFPGGRFRDRTQALTELILQHGLRLADAQEMLKAADQKLSRSFRIKYAAGYPDLMGQPEMSSGPDAPGIPEASLTNDPSLPGTPAQYPQESTQAISMPSSGGPPQQGPKAPHYPMPDPRSIQTMADAAQSGQKEVFDTSVISSLLHVAGDDVVKDGDLGELMGGLDRLGRSLISFYWNRDKFAERFGEAEMPDLEDSIRTAFRHLGDVVLKFKQKAGGDPFPDEMNTPDAGGEA